MLSACNTWADAERHFPGCSAAWDCDGGPGWVGDAEGFRIIISFDDHARPLFLSAGWNLDAPYSWALWDSAMKRWILVAENAIL